MGLRTNVHSFFHCLYTFVYVKSRSTRIFIKTSNKDDFASLLIQSKEYLHKLLPLPLRVAETVAAVKMHSLFFVSNLLISHLVGLMLKLLVGRIQENRSHLNPEEPRGLSPFTYCLIPLYEGTFYITHKKAKRELNNDASH